LLASSPFIYQATVKIRRSGQWPSTKALQQLVVRYIKEKKYQKKEENMDSAPIGSLDGLLHEKAPGKGIDPGLSERLERGKENHHYSFTL
jgi:hypothetical protein